jgi:hypothetical protein
VAFRGGAAAEMEFAKADFVYQRGVDGVCLNNAATVPHRLMAARFSGVLVISLGL